VPDSEEKYLDDAWSKKDKESNKQLAISWSLSSGPVNETPGEMICQV
jgi:hypothetical protein